MADTYVLVHGAWHTGELMEPVAQHLRSKGHTVWCPTLAGNRPGDDRSTTGLADAAQSLVDFFEQHDLQDVRLMGHSYGGMVISHAADRVGHRIRRLVYWNAFVPLDGESLNDADAALAEKAFGLLNPHPNKTFTDKAKLATPLAAMTMGKSYINCQQDTALPHSFSWHPRLSERLGLFRLVECEGSHELCFTHPARLADAIERAGRD